MFKCISLVENFKTTAIYLLLRCLVSLNECGVKHKFGRYSISCIRITNVCVRQLK